MKRARSRTRSAKGGVRQRLRASAREADGHVHSTSALARLLLSLFSWGEMSPQLVQKIASAAFQDAQALVAGQSNLQDLERIASIGSAGRYPNKCYADLLRAVPFKVSIPMATPCKLTFKESLGDLTQHVLLPHELFAALFHAYPSIWRTSIMPNVERLEQFWEQNSGHPAFQESEIRHIRQYHQLVIPLSLHGDGVPVVGVGKAWSQVMTTFSWRSLISSSTATTQHTQFLIYGTFDKLRLETEDQERDTLGQFFKILTWSLSWLLKGLWPDRNWDGKQCLGIISAQLLCCSLQII